MAAAKAALDGFNTISINKAIISEAKEFASIVAEQIGQIVDTIQNINDEVSRKVSNVSYCKQDVKRAANSAYVFVDSVDDIYYYGQKTDEIKRIQSKLRNGNSVPLESYISEMEERFANVGRKYQQFIEHCQKAQNSARRTADECRELQNSANLKKNATRAVGGTATAGIAVGGTIASIVAGVFTLGIGTAIGIPLTVAATGVSAAATHFIAEEFADAERKFRSTSERFERLSSRAFSLHDAVNNLYVTVEHCESNYSVFKRRYTQSDINSLIRLLNDMLDLCKEMYSESSKYREKVKMLRDEVDDI